MNSESKENTETHARGFEDAVAEAIRVREVRLRAFLEGETQLELNAARAVVRGSILARDQKIAAAMALLEWVTDPKYVIRYAHSEPMVRFIFVHFDAWAEEYFKCNSVSHAAKALRGKFETSHEEP